MFKRFLKRLADMSKKQTTIYCIVVTILFFGAVAMFLTGVLFLPPNENPSPSWALPITIVAGVILVLILISILFMTLASNYGTKNHQDEETDIESEENEDDSSRA